MSYTISGIYDSRLTPVRDSHLRMKVQLHDGILQTIVYTSKLHGFQEPISGHKVKSLLKV